MTMTHKNNGLKKANADDNEGLQVCTRHDYENAGESERKIQLEYNAIIVSRTSQIQCYEKLEEAEWAREGLNRVLGIT